jgi:hypothetical protein
VRLHQHPNPVSKFDPDTVGAPLLVIPAGIGDHWVLNIDWSGTEIPDPIPFQRYALGDRVTLPARSVDHIEDPQSCLKHGRAAIPGPHTVFLSMRDKECHWWMPISFEVKPGSTNDMSLNLPPDVHVEPLDLTAHLRHNITDIFRRDYSSPRSPYCSLSVPEQGIGAWAAFDLQPVIDDSGLRGAKGLLTTPTKVSFRTPSAAKASNCLFLSQWQQDQSRFELPLRGKARSIFLLLASSTFPQCSRMRHGMVKVRYIDNSLASLELRTPDTLWPIEQDFLLDDYLFVSHAPIPPRVDLRSGEVRVLDLVSFKGKGKMVPGGAASILKLELDPANELASLQIEVDLYGPVIGLLAVTLARP